MALNLDFKMTFYVNGIKEEKNKENSQINLEFLISIDSEEKAREILTNYGIIILSIHEFVGNQKDFGNFYFIVHHGLTAIYITPKKENRSLQDICHSYMTVGFEVQNIKDFGDKLTESSVKTILSQTQQNLEKQKIIQKINKDKQQEKENLIFEDKTLNKQKEVIKRILPRCDEIINLLIKNGEITQKTFREIKDSEENLKKLSMGTNSEKIRNNLQQLFSMIESLEPQYYKILSRNGSTISPKSIITHFDILKEEYKLQYAKNKNKAGLAINSTNQYYLILGRVGIFVNFLKLDILNKIVDIKKIINKFYDLIEISLLLIVCELIVYIIVSYGGEKIEVNNVITTLINTTIIGFCFSLLKDLGKKNKYIFYGAIPVCIFLFFVLKKFIISNFAL